MRLSAWANDARAAGLTYENVADTRAAVQTSSAYFGSPRNSDRVRACVNRSGYTLSFSRHPAHELAIDDNGVRATRSPVSMTVALKLTAGIVPSRMGCLQSDVSTRSPG